MTRVLVLGVGASVSAGYPLTVNLLECVRQEADKSRFIQLSNAWDTWRQYLVDLPRELEILRTARNPELILSFTDLFDAAASEEDRRRTLDAVGLAKETGHADTTRLEDYFTSAGRCLASKAREGRAHLLEALTWYFAFRHMDDKNAPRSDRDYLRRLLRPLDRGDAVLTFNWDSLIERTLTEDGRWSPLDGYGFARQLTHHRGLQQRAHIPNGKLPTSDITILKLHGSFGWRRIGQRGMYLDAENLLNGFEWPNSSGLLPLHDAEEPESYSPTDPVVAYPSYLKQFSHPPLALIWRTAASCLERAEYVEIVGYSLPASDAAAWSLFLPLAERVRGGQVRVVIRDKSLCTLECWKELLGPRAEFREETI